MIKLQNNFTTPEQSRRLLKLGVPEPIRMRMYLFDYVEGQIQV